MIVTFNRVISDIKMEDNIHTDESLKYAGAGSSIVSKALKKIDEKKRQQTLERKKLFIQKSLTIHTNAYGTPKYDYSKVEYTNCDAKVTIVCPKEDHGDFIRTAFTFLIYRRGCPHC